VRTRAALTSAFASIGILAVGWQAGAAVTAANNAALAPASATTATTPASSTPTSTPSTTPSASAASSATATATPTPTAAASGAKDGTYTGSTVSTRFGNVQVKVTISGGKITDITPLQLTDAEGRSVQISAQVAPILREEVLSAQSANVQNVSGGTYTTRGYLQSLQSALDQAGFTG
jgi:uncharacterized protein with FMN-binding domain